jgi:hypothetical protein
MFIGPTPVSIATLDIRSDLSQILPRILRDGAWQTASIRLQGCISTVGISKQGDPNDLEGQQISPKGLSVMVD